MENEIKNPQAFPLKEPLLNDCEGMTLRDYFAAKALNGLLSSNPIFNTQFADNAEGGAIMAYEWADAMLNERQKTNPQ